MRQSKKQWPLPISVIVLTLSYYISGRLGLLLAIPPGYATAVWPASGVALAALLLFGYHLWPGVLLGSFFINIFISFDGSSSAAIIKSISIAMGIGAGAVFQAVFGAWLISKFVDIKKGLTTARDVFVFIGLGGPVSSIINATWSDTIMLLLGEIASNEFAFSWLTWWVGDTIGVIVFLPLIFTFLGNPIEIWQKRKMTMGSVLSLSIFIVIIIFILASSTEQERIKLVFQRQAEVIAASFEKECNDHSSTLFSIRGLMKSSDKISENQFHQFLNDIKKNFNGVQALEWIPIIPGEDRDSLKSYMQSNCHPKFDIIEKNSEGKFAVSDLKPYYAVSLYVEPVNENEWIIGYDNYSDNKCRKAMEQACDSGKPIAIECKELTYVPENQSAVVVFLPVYKTSDIPTTIEERQENIFGFVSGIFRIGDVLVSAMEGLEINFTETVLIDQTDKTNPSILATYYYDENEGKFIPPGQKLHTNNDFAWLTTIEIAGKSLKIIINPTPQYLAINRSWSAWVVLAGGLIFTGLLGNFLLILTGRSIMENSRVVELAKLNDELYSEISIREKTEEALLQSSKDLKKSQELAHIGSWRLEIATNEVTWTEELYRMYGFDPLLPPPPYTEHMKLFTAESWERLSTALAKTSEFGIPYDLELETVREDGNNGWMWVRGEAEKNENGKITNLWGAAQDISSRKKIEFALRESEKRFKTLHDASFGGIIIHYNGVILECNKGLSDLTGFDYLELIGMELIRLITEESHGKIIQNFQDNPETTIEITGIRKDGSNYPVRMETRKIPYKGKDAAVTEFRDITEFKLAEKEKKELEGKLRQSQKMEAIGRLAGGVAHDFNNMLTVIIGHAEMAMFNMLPTNELYKDLEDIKKAGERSAELTRQLLAFARKQTVAPKVLNLNNVVTDMMTMLNRLIGEDIELSWHPCKEIWPVKMDISQIDQILANLCINARDAITNIGNVVIETNNVIFDDDYCDKHVGFVFGEYVMLAVSDNGCGMDNETIDNIFEPFFTTKGTGKGTGLGLATVYGVVKQNNGFINVYSEIGVGTTFKIYLPRYANSGEVHHHKSTLQSIQHGNETVLIVEDDPSILKISKNMLGSLGYNVLSANSPNEAIELATDFNSEIHLLLTDVIMPQMNGKDLSQKIIVTYPKIKIIFMSGYTANLIAHHGVLDEGINFIQKPFLIDDIAAKVREVLDSD